MHIFNIAQTSIIPPPPPQITALYLPENHRFSLKNRGQAVFLISSVVKVCAVLTAQTFIYIQTALKECYNEKEQYF
jgi:hypothetical protein